MTTTTSDVTHNEWLDTIDIATELVVSPRTVRRLLAAREISYHRVGGGRLIRVRREDLDDYIRRTRISATA